LLNLSKCFFYANLPLLVTFWKHFIQKTI